MLKRNFQIIKLLGAFLLLSVNGRKNKKKSTSKRSMKQDPMFSGLGLVCLGRIFGFFVIWLNCAYRLQSEWVRHLLFTRGLCSVPPSGWASTDSSGCGVYA